MAEETTRIHHETTRSEWEVATATGTYRGSTRGRTFDEAGFIHGSSGAQLPEVAELLHAGADDELVVLAMDARSLDAAGLAVRFEDGGGGTLFPHIYAPLPCALVVGV